jgi:hypothetical protein
MTLRRTLWGMPVVAAIAACAPLASAPTTACDRDCLVGAADRYFDALSRGHPGAAGFADGARMTENGILVNPQASALTRATTLHWHQVFADPHNGQVVAFGRHDDDAGPVLYAVRLKLRGQRIVEAEAMVNHRDAHPFFAPQALASPRAVFERIEPEPSRRSREQLQSIANRYFDAIEQHSSSAAPFHDECMRVENGVRTTDNPQATLPRSCRSGMQLFTYIPVVRDRRFAVIDEERGVVVAWAVFDMPGTATTAQVDGQTVELAARVRQPRSMRLAEVFKIVDGQLHTIEAYIRYEPLGAATGWPE